MTDRELNLRYKKLVLKLLGRIYRKMFEIPDDVYSEEYLLLKEVIDNKLVEEKIEYETKLGLKEVENG